MRTRVGLMFLGALVLVSSLSSCATSRRNKYAMQRGYTSGTTATVVDSPGETNKNQEQRVKAAFGQ